MSTPQNEPIEYWVNEASKGRNIAECWQNCNRILDEAVKSERLSIISRLKDRHAKGHELSTIIESLEAETTWKTS